MYEHKHKMAALPGPGNAMPLRNGTVVGQVVLPKQHWPVFEQGVTLAFNKWMALRLAVENQWGGSHSQQKADELIDDVLHWFTSKREHYADELEIELDEFLQAEFNTQAEDGSPGEVARSLVAMYQECLVGNFSTIQRLAAQAAPPTAACVPDAAAAALDGGASAAGGNSSSSSGSDSEGDGEGTEGMDVDEAPVGVPLEQQQQQQPQGPVVDEDGFQVVARRGGRRR